MSFRPRQTYKQSDEYAASKLANAIAPGRSIESILFSSLDFFEETVMQTEKQVERSCDIMSKEEVMSEYNAANDEFEYENDFFPHNADPTDGAFAKVKEGLKSGVNNVYRKVAKLRTRAKAAFTKLTPLNAIRSARILIATVGQAAAFAIVVSVFTEIRRRLMIQREMTGFSGFRGGFLSSTHEMVIAVLVSLIAANRLNAIEALAAENAEEAKNSKALDLVIDTILDRLGTPCVDAVRDPNFVISLIIELSESFLQISKQACTRDPRAKAEMRKSSYPILAKYLVTAAAKTSPRWISRVVDKITSAPWHTNLLANPDGRGIDMALNMLGIEGRKGINEGIKRLFTNLFEALNKYEGDAATYKFQDISDKDIKEGENALMVEKDQTLVEMASRETDPEDDDDEQFWDADDFIVEEQSNGNVKVKSSDSGSNRASVVVESMD